MDAQISKRPPAALFTLVTDAWTKPYWDAAAQHRLVAPQCERCASFRMPPTPFCPNCRSQAIRWVELSGRAILYSYSVVSRAIMAGMEDCLPYVTAVVELPDAAGLRLVSNVVEAPLDRLRIGAPLQVVFDDRDDGVSVPRFRLAEVAS